MQDSHTAQEPHLDPTPEDHSGSILLLPRRRQIPKQKFKGCFMGMGEDGRVGLPRNLLYERLLWLLSHQVGSLSLTAASAVFFFIHLEWSAGSWQSGEAMLMTLAPRGNHSGGGKSCNVLSATLIRETHRELVAWRQLSSWYLPCMLITSPPGSESALSLGWWQ